MIDTLASECNDTGLATKLPPGEEPERAVYLFAEFRVLDPVTVSGWLGMISDHVAALAPRVLSSSDELDETFIKKRLCGLEVLTHFRLGRCAWVGAANP